jgi:hypothetical protein
MRDSVEFLRSKAKEYEGEYNPEPSKIFKAAAKEIARLRRRLAEARLTDAEREAVKWALEEAVWSYNPDCGDHPDTLRGLLERLRNGAVDGCDPVQ